MTLDDFTLLGDEEGFSDPREGRVPLDKRIVFIPDAKVIVSLVPTQDALELRRFDLDEALDASGIVRSLRLLAAAYDSEIGRPRRTAHGVWPAKTARVEMGNLGFRLRAFLFWTGPILRDSCQ